MGYDKKGFPMIVRHSTSQDATTCPECSGPITPGSTSDEATCDECGLVVAEDRLDRGPEWRAFTAAQHEERSRVGSPRTEVRHDRGLSTVISWKNKDARGNQLSARKRTQMQRLRKWDNRYRTRDSTERHLKQAFGEIQRVASALGLPQPVYETASVLYRRAHSEGLLVGRSIEGIATAAVYAAARQEKIPRTLDEMTTVARVEYDRIARAYRAIAAELELAIEPTDPMAYLPRFTSALECSEETHRQAHNLLEDVVGTTFTNGKHPAGLAASALYAATCETGERLTQQEISDVSDITCMTIRTHYRDFLDDNNE